MDSKPFVRDLSGEIERLLSRLRTDASIPREEAGFSVAAMLRLALKNEMEATVLAARWIPTTSEIDVRMGFARQVGDEGKHYNLIEGRLRSLGDALEGFDPLAKGFSPLTEYLLPLPHVEERLAGGQFTREAIALVKNQQFIELCEARGDQETARLYRDIIQPDEKYHHELGRRLLEKYATSPEAQARARSAARRTLELAEELQSSVLQKSGLHHTPGC